MPEPQLDAPVKDIEGGAGEEKGFDSDSPAGEAHGPQMREIALVCLLVAIFYFFVFAFLAFLVGFFCFFLLFGLFWF